VLKVPDRVFIYHLSLVDALRMLASSRLRHATTIHSKTSSPLARRLVGRRLSTIPDHSEECLDGMNYCDLRSRTTLAMTAVMFGNEPNPHLRRHLEQSMAREIYQSIDLLHDERLMAGAPGDRVEVLLPFGPFHRGLTCRLSGPHRVIGWCVGQRNLRLSLRRIGRYLYRAGGALVRPLALATSPARRPPPATRRPALCVPDFRGGTHIDGRHDLFWLGDRQAPYPIVLEYVTDYPLSAGFVRQLSDKGVRVVTTRPGATPTTGVSVWWPGGTYLRYVARACCRLAGRLARLPVSRARALGLWKAWQAFQFDMLAAERIDLYRSQGVRAEFRSGFTPAEPAHSEALRQIGGASISAQYSTGVDPYGSHTSSSTFHLSIGTWVHSWGFPLAAEYHLLNGYPFSGAATGARDRVEALRNQLRERGAQRAICFLDEGFTSPRLAAETLRVFAHLVDAVLREPSLGLVVKPKKNASLAALEREIGEPYRAALATGRVAALDWAEYPAAAGAAADLTIGVLSTAPMECAIMGCRTIYLSPSGYVPRFMEPARSNVFDSAERVNKAIDALIAGRDDGSLGCHTEEFLRAIDHHRDHKGSERIDWLLSQFLGAVEEGATRDEAIERTVRGYAARWGAGSVVHAGASAPPAA
jgi:hypothetical protein